MLSSRLLTVRVHVKVSRIVTLLDARFEAEAEESAMLEHVFCRI